MQDLFQIERNSNTERQISDMFEEYWESTGVTVLNDLWREKWGEYVVDDDDDARGPASDLPAGEQSIVDQPDGDLPVEELAKLCVTDSKSFVTPDESIDELDVASDVAKGELNSSNPES